MVDFLKFVSAVLYLMYESGDIELLREVTEDQCARFVDRYPSIHIFLEKENS